MLKQQFIKELSELEVYAEILERKASSIRKGAHKARMKLAGVSTPAVRKGAAVEYAIVVAKRNKRMLKNNTK